MATQKYTNLGQSKLASAIVAGDTSLAVNSATNFPTAGDFYINLNDGTNQEICKVTAVSGTTFTIARGVAPTSATGFAAGTVVTEILAKEVLDGIRADMISSGAVGSLPTASNGHNGDTYFSTDGAHIYRNTGSVWEAYGPLVKLTPIVDGDFSWINQGTATSSANGSTIQLKTPTTNSADDMRIRYKAVTFPATLVVAVKTMTVLTGAGYSMAGIGARDSASGKMTGVGILSGTNAGRLAPYTFHATAYNSFSLVTGSDYVGWPGLMYFKLVADNTNYTYSWSVDGANWVQIAQETYATAGPTSPNQLFFWVYSRSSGDCYATFFGWNQS